MNQSPNEKELLELCKTKVAVKFTYLDSGKWVNNDFIRLSEDILEITKAYLSPTSLKRIFGKISSEAFPKKTTLDILSQYIGHKDWNEFVLQQAPFATAQSLEEKHPESDPLNRSNPSLLRKVAFICMPLIIVLAIPCYFYFSKQNPAADFSFTQTKPFGKAPFTATFKVNFPLKTSDEVNIHFNDPFETDLNFINYRLTESSQTVAHTYMIPGVYHPQLQINNKVVDSADVAVYSNGWEWVAVNYHAKERVFYTIKDQSSFRKDGIFCVPSTEVAKYHVDTMTSYCMRYMNYQDFKVDAENLKLEMKVNNPIPSGKKCTDIEIQLKFKHWNVGFMLFHKGCNGNYSRVQMGSKILNGIDNDLSMFEVDLNQWQNLSVKIKNATAWIEVNGTKLAAYPIEGDLGMLQGISINSQESARVDHLKISSSDKVLLSEDF